MLLASYPFLDALWTMALFFFWIIWFWILITVFADVFRRRDIGGGAKTLWLIFVIVLPYLGVFVYLIANHDGMAERRMDDVRAQQQAVDDRIRAVAPSNPAAEIEKAKQLFDSGAISQSEFDALKAKALA
jgi:hypothetical protein